VTRQARLHPAAEQELDEVATFYDLEGPGLGQAFIDDFERVGEQVRLLPSSSPIAPGPARRKLLTRFPYALIYSIVEDDVFVLAVAHGRGRPFYWQDRLLSCGCGSNKPIEQNAIGSAAPRQVSRACSCAPR